MVERQSVWDMKGTRLFTPCFVQHIEQMKTKLKEGFLFQNVLFILFWICKPTFVSNNQWDSGSCQELDFSYHVWPNRLNISKQKPKIKDFVGQTFILLWTCKPVIVSNNVPSLFYSGFANQPLLLTVSWTLALQHNVRCLSLPDA